MFEKRKNPKSKGLWAAHPLNQRDEIKLQKNKKKVFRQLNQPTSSFEWWYAWNKFIVARCYKRDENAPVRNS